MRAIKHEEEEKDNQLNQESDEGYANCKGEAAVKHKKAFLSKTGYVYQGKWD